MLCPKCCKENPESTQVCQYCGCIFDGVSVVDKGPDVKTSSFAIASFVFGILSIFVLPVIAVSSRNEVFGLIGFLFTSMAAIILGIIGLVQINTGADRITGRGSAIIGISVAGVLLFLIGILGPVLTKIKMSAFPMDCGSNLSGIGKAMYIYANDYKDQFPRAGGPSSRWGRTANWQAGNRSDAFGLKNGNGEATISSSLFLLVKYAEVTPKSFVCKSETKASVFKLSLYGVDPDDKELIDVWDFGPNPAKHCSYSYHLPYGLYALNVCYLPGVAVAADRNPWMPSPFARARDFSKFDPNGTPEQQRYGNAIAHKGEGQNVLFMDGHVYFEKRPFCGVKDDNIYTYYAGSAPNWDKRKGLPPQTGSQPASRVDSLLVNDPTVANQK